MTVSIVPQPRSVTESASVLTLGPQTVITAEPDCAETAEILRQRLHTATGYELPIMEPLGDTTERQGAIALEIDPELGASAYEVLVDETGAVLRGGDAAGVFHASQVLLQLLPPAVFRRVALPGVRWKAPGVRIADSPRFGWRGMLIDVSRHYFGRNSLFTLIDALALHRMNVLHLHLTDDQGWRIQIERYPALAEVGSWRPFSIVDNHYIRAAGAQPVRDFAPHDGYLTKDDLRELVEYARRRHIMILPEIDLPGHSQAAIAAHPELGTTTESLGVWTDWGVNVNVLNVDESTIEFYQNVLDEVVDVFPGLYVHIGGDEAPREQWRSSPAVQARMRQLGLVDEDALQSWLIGRFAAHLAARGRRLVGWDEILDGGLAPGATVMSWRGTDGGIAAAEAGHDVVMTPDPQTYLYHPQSPDRTTEPLGADPVVGLRTVFEYDPMPPGLSAQAQAHVLGAQCQMWTEFVSSERQLHQMVFPRLCAFSEAVWRNEPTSGSAFEDFERRLQTHRERLHALDIDGYAPPRSDGWQGNPSQTVDSP